VQVTTADITAEFGDASLQANNVTSALKAQGLGTVTGIDHMYDGTIFLGGPIKHDRVWFFENFRYLNENDIHSDFSAPLTTRDTMNLVKVTSQITKANNVEVGFYYRNYSNFPYTAVASFDPVWTQRYLEGARGATELVGCTSQCVSVTPDTQMLLWNGAPYRVRLYNSPLVQHLEDRGVNAYAQDQWVLDRVTLNLGVRFEHMTGNLPESTGGPGQYEPVVVSPAQNGVINLSTVSPRIGGVWDVKGDHKTTVKASGGRFYNQLNTSYVLIASPAGIGYREYDWTDKNGDGIYEPGEEGTLRVNTVPNPANLPQVDPNLKGQYTDVYTVGFEHALTATLSLAVNGIFKHDGNIFGTVNAAVPFADYVPITVTNPLSNQPMTIYTLPVRYQAIAAQTVLTNPTSPVALVRKYKGFEAVVRRRMTGVWQFEGSYVYGKGEGNVGNAYSDSLTASYLNPNSLINRYGDLPLGPRHQLKLSGSWLAPYGVVISGYFEALAGIPWTETFFGSSTVKGAETFRFLKSAYPQIQSETYIDVAVEPAGTRKMDTTTHLDLRVEKKFALTKGQSLSFMINVFNVLNSDAVTLIKTLNMALPGFGDPAQVQPSRQVQLGVRWTF
jgi:hypothetical protein